MYDEAQNVYGAARLQARRSPTVYPEDPYPKHEYGKFAQTRQGAAQAGAANPGPLKIAHVGPSLLRAGVETWFRGLIHHLDPARAVVTQCIVTMPEHLDPVVARELGVPAFFGGRAEVRQAVRDNDVLLCWGPAEIGEWLSDLPPRLGVFVAHGEGAWTRHALVACAPVIDHVIAVSQRVKQRLCEGFPTTVILNGVDGARLAPTLPRQETRARLNFASDDFVLSYVGRFSGEKRPETVIEAVARLPACFKALYVGWGGLKGELLQLANERIPGRYAFVTAANDVGDYYAAMDALCLASFEEGFGLVILEAMLSERPVIASEVGCVPEVIHDRINGLVVDGTPESVARAALALRQHPAWARGLAAEGRAHAEQHGHARTMARRYADLLHELWQLKTGETRHPAPPPPPFEARGAGPEAGVEA